MAEIRRALLAEDGRELGTCDTVTEWQCVSG